MACVCWLSAVRPGILEPMRRALVGGGALNAGVVVVTGVVGCVVSPFLPKVTSGCGTCKQVCVHG